MFIPLSDANHLRYIRRPYATYAIIAANILAYFLISLQGTEVSQASVIGLGYIPSVLNGMAVLPEGFELVPPYLTYLTYSFLHIDLWHLAGNMLFLWVFADNVEDAMGPWRFLVFYLACAIAGALMHGLVAPNSLLPLIGASGAVAGIVSAYLILHPKVKIWVLVFARIPMRLPAYIVLALWIAFQFLMIFMGDGSEVSWAAHVGGIIAGAILVLPLRRRNFRPDPAVDTAS